ncbi:filamentous hemagglutinin N-terminal domain-containing protein [Calothrix sp. UHCC 0171]|uniref:beta strand repeat-containing protein n=1 Tax=Calothrix sp. UHCC 0171 TaxID=3110245 RepID=UPI002B1F2BD9|nr:filamentous hemagglutinin N-terminal domain-containing protein [Calothrix sp. UHCC 0171]MEA5572567.1 filamentous hemagglutinin N-terminal domain-containing protein [Calothrix sp. UHCC 0171]
MNQVANSLGKLLTCGFLVFAAPIFPVTAQITPDNTLGTESSRLDTNVLINNVLGDKINGGAVRESNLFHSFSEFNINDGQRVYFSNPSGVINILTRVTGGNASNILGTLGVDGNANLFLMNPNGILFGQNASLDVRGSFVGTTANGLQFGNQGVFSATNPQAPALLTVNPSALLFSQVQSSAGITNQSQAPAGVNPNGDNTTGLRVPDGKSLLLVGGNVNLDGGSLRAYDGRIELTGLTTPGNIGLNVAGDIFSLNIPNDVAFADVSLDNNSVISIFGNQGGEIVINAGNIGIDNSFLFAGISAGKGTPTTQAGDINLSATASISISQDSFIDNSVSGNGNAGNIFVRAKDAVTVNSGGIFSNVEAVGIGNAGNIDIQSGSLSLNNRAALSTGIFGQGNGGNISLEISDGIQLSNAFMYSNITSGGVGNGGEINIKGGSLSLTDSSQIQSRIEDTDGNLPGGQGNTGNININIKGNISFSQPIPGNANGIITEVGVGAIGNAGNLTINAGSLEIKEGSEIQGSTRGKGNAGNITINTRDSLTIDGRDGKQPFFSRIIAAVQPGAEGNAGNINITANNLNIINGAFFSSSTFSKGDAGNITVDVRDTTKFEDRVFIASNVFGIGKGGDIRLNTGTLSMTAGSFLSTNVLGQGNVGNIIVNARDTIILDDVTGDKLTGIQSSLLTGGVGKGGNIDITTGSLFAINGASLLAVSDGQGDAGNITINARDVISFDSSEGNKFKSSVGNEIGSDTVGNGGDIRITAREISFKNGSKIGASSFGQGNAGNILIDASDKVSFDGVGGSFQVSSGVDTTTSKTGNGGDISVKTGTLSLINGAQINASTAGKGNGGDITIDARDRINFEGIGSNQNFSGVFSIVNANSVGNAGNIKLTTNSLSLSNSGRVSASTVGKGNGGDITINAGEITASGLADGLYPSGIFSTVEATGVGKGGNINVNADSLALSDRAQINASTLGQGDAGQIFLNINKALTLNEGYILSSVSSGGVGTAGDIEIRASTLSATEGSQIQSALLRPSKNLPAAQGRGGNIRVNATDTVNLSGYGKTGFSTGLITVADRGTSGEAGDITVNTGNFTVSDGAIVSAATSNSDNGGNITINAKNFTANNGGQLATNTRGSGNAGSIKLNVTDNITITGSDPNFRDRVTKVTQRLQQPGETDQLNDVIFNQGAESGLFANTEIGSTGRGGSIFIDPPQITIRDGAKVSVNSDGTGDAGNISILGGTLSLDNRATISAQTASSQGGNINLQLADFVLLRRGSLISTTAGNTQAGGDGGNITINTPFIVAVPGENSDISANAFTGKGGQINIATQGIFGIEPSAQASDATNDITASSQLGIQGEIAINNPEIDPTKGIIELPNDVVDATNQLSQLCPRGYDAFIKPLSSFTITGRDALPLSPLEPLQGTATIPLATLDNEGNAGIQQRTNYTSPLSASPPLPLSPSPRLPSPPSQIIEAQGLVKNSRGEIFLVAQAPQTTPSSQPTVSACLQNYSKN